MLIALDIDDTITLHPTFFAAFSQAMVAAGHGIVIITLRESESSAKADLEAMGIRFHRIVCANPTLIAEHGHAWKASVCRELGVDVFFEDSPAILSHVDPRTLGFLVTQPAGRADLATVPRLAVTTMPLYEFEADAEELMRTSPPQWEHGHKIAIARRTCGAGAVHRGRIRFSRWALAAMPDGNLLERPAPSVEIVAGPMEYAASADDETHWHLNFADPDLFVCYATELLAQDEWQVLEHPALAALRERLLADGWNIDTDGPSGPTPILIEGVERRCELRVTPGPGDRWPNLYGNRFARASVEEVLRATRIIDPPTVSNVIAIAAPACGRGAYAAAEIATILRTAMTAFAAAVRRSRQNRVGRRRTIIHTGLWGCGAFGGNPVLMTLLQLVAARATGVERLRFYSPDMRRKPDIEHAVRVLDDLTGSRPSIRPPHLIQALASLGFEWGESDGN